MKTAGIMAIIGAGAVAACASTPMPVAKPVPGVSFRPGNGHALTAEGAVSVKGMTVAVADFSYDEGLLAKRQAERACIARGSRFNPAAIGRFASPEWIFPGACA